MITPQLDIVRLFSTDLSKELTINQIAKVVDRSYGAVNKYVHELIEEGVLNRKIIGSAILCSLNYANEQTIGLLTLHSINKRVAFFKKIKEGKLEKVTSFIEECEDKPVHCIYLVDSTITIVAENAEQFTHFKVHGFKVTVITRTEFERTAKKIDFSRHVVLKHHEQFWRMIRNLP